MKLDFNLIDMAAQSKLGMLLTWLLPVGERRGHEWVALNPNRNDRNLGSFRINLLNGKWSDFALRDVKGVGAISIVSYILKIPRREAARVVAKYIGDGNEK